MNDSDTEQSGVVDVAGTFVSAATPCLRCDYELKGLPQDGACPECGLKVWESTSSLSRSGDPRWLRRIELGALIVVAGWLIALAGPLVLMCVQILFWFVPRRLAGGLKDNWGNVPVAVVVLAGVGLLVLGTWFLTTREWRLPSVCPPWRGDETIRRCTRLSLIVSLGMSGLAIGFELTRSHNGWLQTALLIAAYITGLLTVVGTFRLLSGVARRVPSRLLGADAKTYSHWSLIAGSIGVAVLIGPLMIIPMHIEISGRLWHRLWQLRKKRSGDVADRLSTPQQ